MDTNLPKLTTCHRFRRCSVSMHQATETDLNTSVVYQNPGWPKIGGQGPIAKY